MPYSHAVYSIFTELTVTGTPCNASTV